MLKSRNDIVFKDIRYNMYALNKQVLFSEIESNNKDDFFLFGMLVSNFNSKFSIFDCKFYTQLK